jgi:hypothetical protein
MNISTDLDKLIELGHRYGYALNYSETEIVITFGYSVSYPDGKHPMHLTKFSTRLTYEFRCGVFQPIARLHDPKDCKAYAACWDQICNFKEAVTALGYRIEER